MTDITAFIRDRLAEEQSAAEGARDDSGRWFASRVGPDQGHGSNVAELREHNGSVDRGYTRITDPVYAPQVDHMVLHDPARVLAQVAAMRAIVSRALVWLDGEPDDGTHSERMARTVYDENLRDIAGIWSSHPDYDRAWAPNAQT